MRIRRDAIPFDEAGWRFEWADQLESPVTQRLSAVDECNDVLSEILVMKMPDGSLSVVFSAGLDQADSVSKLAEFMLLEEVTEQAVREHSKFVRCVLSGKDARDRAETLTRSGFHHAVKISQQSVAVSEVNAAEIQPAVSQSGHSPFEADNDGNCTFEILDARSVPEAVQRELAAVLDQTMKNSSDAAEFPRSSGREMLWLWSLLNVDVTLTAARYEGKACGLVVAAVDAGDGVRPAVATVEYIGLLPEFRQRGLASRLLCNAALQLSSKPYLPDELLLVTHVDVQNFEALRFYARHGFVEEDQTAVWLFIPN